MVTDADLRSCVKVEVVVPVGLPVPNKTTISVDVKQTFNFDSVSVN